MLVNASKPILSFLAHFSRDEQENLGVFTYTPKSVIIWIMVNGVQFGSGSLK